MRQTIQTVVDSGLCCSCGTCVGICQNNVISLILDKNFQNFVPHIESSECSGCGICYDVCPGHSVDFKSLNLVFYGKESEDIILGNFLKCYVGYASEYEIRYNASSGGIVTGLLVYALEKRLIDGALVTRMNIDHPLEPQPFIAQTREEIVASSSSKYCPVSPNTMIREILQSPDGAKFAVVGLPCHIHGIRKAESLNKKLKDKIVLHIGLFCSHNDTFWQTDYLIKIQKISKKDISQIRYRGEGYPGKLSISLKNGQIRTVPFQKAILPHVIWFNAMNRCLYCCDNTAELAEISVGDAWLPEIWKENERVGKSIIIARNEKANNLLNIMANESYLCIRSLEPEEVKKSISWSVTKKIDVQVRMSFRNIVGKKTPLYNTMLIKPHFINYFRGFIPLIISTCSSNVYLRPLNEKLMDLYRWYREKKCI